MTPEPSYVEARGYRITPRTPMKLRWTGTTPLRVRINATDDKVDIAPGDTFDVPREDHAIYLMRYHRPLLVRVTSELPEETPTTVPRATAVAKKRTNKKAA